MVNMIIGAIDESDTADINNDGGVNVLDIVELVSIIINGSTALPDECYLEPETGPCMGYVPMYYFDEQTQSCQMFIWGGCAGIVPFETMEDCINTCQ